MIDDCCSDVSAVNNSDLRLIMLYKGLKGAARIPTNDLAPHPPPLRQIRHVRQHHSLAFQTPFAITDIYKGSFFPQTIRDWNLLHQVTDCLLSAAEGAEDCC